jgi:hypothetical protein
MNGTSIRRARAAAIPVLVLACTAANAAEGLRLRALIVGSLGSELAAPVRGESGFFGNAVLTYTEVTRAVDDAGNTLSTAPRVVPLPTGVPTAGAIPNGTFSLRVPSGTVNLTQTQTQLNLVGGYATAPSFAGGRLVLRANLPLIEISRNFQVIQPAPVVTPTPSSPPLPPAALGAVNAVASAATAQWQTQLAATAASQNQSVTGLGDLDLTAAWVRDFDRLRVSAAIGLQLPTGDYDAKRGPNPGFGDYRTVQIGVVSSYAVSESLTVAGRLSWGTNSTNGDTQYRSGNFAVVEGSVLKKLNAGPVVGVNLLAIRQTTDDRSNGVAVPSQRYRNNSVGPFLAWPMDSRTAVAVQVAQTFGGRNALVSRSVQVRASRAW